MSADIVKYANLPFIVGDNQQRLSCHFDGCTGARLDEFMSEAGKHPVFAEYLFLFSAKERFTGIGLLGQPGQHTAFGS
ncbi:hypothetical protein D3C76_903310 [compost metagenome]